MSASATRIWSAVGVWRSMLPLDAGAAAPSIGYAGDSGAEGVARASAAAARRR